MSDQSIIYHVYEGGYLVRSGPDTLLAFELWDKGFTFVTQNGELCEIDHGSSEFVRLHPLVPSVPDYHNTFGLDIDISAERLKEIFRFFDKNQDFVRQLHAEMGWPFRDARNQKYPGITYGG